MPQFLIFNSLSGAVLNMQWQIGRFWRVQQKVFGKQEHQVTLKYRCEQRKCRQKEVKNKKKPQNKELRVTPTVGECLSNTGALRHQSMAVDTSSVRAQSRWGSTPSISQALSPLLQLVLFQSQPPSQPCTGCLPDAMSPWWMHLSRLHWFLFRLRSFVWFAKYWSAMTEVLHKFSSLWLPLPLRSCAYPHFSPKAWLHSGRDYFSYGKHRDL